MIEKDLFAENIKKEIEELRSSSPGLKDEDLFIVWFLRARISNDVNEAAKSLTNGPGDKGIDAVYFDDSAKCVFLIQGKYRYKMKGKSESRDEVMGFARLAHMLYSPRKEELEEFCDGLNSVVEDKIKEARKRLLQRGYTLWLYYITLGKCSPALRREAEHHTRLLKGNSYLEVLDKKRLDHLMKDYLDGVAPPIPILDLKMESGRGIALKGVLQRFDKGSEIESWVFPMKGDAIAELYIEEKTRLFARNIRGFLGENTPVNRSMENTLRKEPERFFYFNNGITIVCDEAEKISSQGIDILRVNNPQIINGLQTTRTLARSIEDSRKASVIVRVIKVPRDISNGASDFDTLVSKIVEGTNWQNEIRASDLVSNDRRQIELQREFQKRGYLYARKRETKSEAQRSAGSKQFAYIKKEDLARAVAGCDLDPVEARSGVENLFEEDKYPVIFPNSDARYYLTRFWTMRMVTYLASGYPERGYAKWLVLGFIWSRLASILNSRNKQDKYLELMRKRDRKLEAPLIQATEKVFYEAINYWRKNRGKGARALDISTFFRNKRGRHLEFASFWAGKNNKSRRRFKMTWDKIESVITAD